MSIAFVLDEDMRGPLWRAILDHNSQGIQPIDATRVGDLLDLPLGTRDPDLLIWAENAQRIIVTFDRNTMPGHLADHLAAGNRAPGVFLVSKGASISAVLDFLVAATYASEPFEWENRIQFIP